VGAAITGAAGIAGAAIMPPSIGIAAGMAGTPKPLWPQHGCRQWQAGGHGGGQ
jgi:hypothetical protein